MKSFIVSNKGIAFEDFDEEIVVVNLPVGYYYSMKGTARKLFLQAVNGTNQNNLAKYIVANYDLALTEALAFTEQFIEKLYNNQLVHWRSGGEIGMMTMMMREFNAMKRRRDNK